MGSHRQASIHFRRKCLQVAAWGTFFIFYPGCHCHVSNLACLVRGVHRAPQVYLICCAGL